MGGLRHQMQTTYWTYLIGALALAGIVPAGGLLVEGRNPQPRRQL